MNAVNMLLHAKNQRHTLSRLFGCSWPVLSVLSLYWASIAVMSATAIQHSDGRFVYPLDDTYIHMSISRTFSETGVWGISPDGFSSSTSAPLWTLILAFAYRLFGVSTLTPLILNIAVGTLLIICIYRILRRHSGAVLAFLYLFFVVAVIPLPAMTMLGMEHVLQILLIVLFVDCGIRTVLETKYDFRTRMSLLVLAPLVSTIRYESIFIIGVLLLIFLLRRRYSFALLLGSLATLPLVLYALLSVSHGWLPLPHSVLIKGARPFHRTDNFVEAIGLRFFKQAMANPHMLTLALLGLMGYWIFRSRGRSDNKNALTATVFIYTICLHLQFAQTGWLYRYEAYIVALGLVTAFPLVTWLLQKTKTVHLFRSNRIQTTLFSAITLALLITPFVGRAVKSFIDTPRAMNDRYFEHIKPAEFLACYYGNSTVVVNDIGAISYYSSCRTLDVCGIGNVEPVLRKIKKRDYTKKDVFEWAEREGAEIAVVQIACMQSLIPEKWILVASWNFPRNVVFGDKRICFFAMNANAATILARNITEFVREIPEDITIKFNTAL